MMIEQKLLLLFSNQIRLPWNYLRMMMVTIEKSVDGCLVKVDSPEHTLMCLKHIFVKQGHFRK